MIDYLTTPEAATLLGCGKRHIRKLFHAGLLYGRWRDGHMELSRASVLSYRPMKTGSHRATRRPAIELLQPYHQEAST